MQLGCSNTVAYFPPDCLQLVIMNFSSFVGRLSPGLYANYFGVQNIVVAAAGCCAILILGMIGVKSVTSIIVIGVFYGFSSGVCKRNFT
jgi:hypothetical protein